ncbi:MAG: hypothetical protein FWG50_08660 [Kiritimatiellaeota bacterium]|nr:hypothetical protein [Kiritimatiellota bacterium]
MKSLSTITLSVGIIALSAWTGFLLFVFGFLCVLFTHDGSPAFIWFTWGALTLLLLLGNRITAVLIFCFMPIYWGLLTWASTKVKSWLHLAICFSLFLLLHMFTPYWVTFHAMDSNIKEQLFAQLSQPWYRPFLIAQIIIVGIANGYLFSLPFVFYWLSRRNPLPRDSQNIGTRR